MPPEVVDVLRVLDRAAASKNPDNALIFRLLAATGCRRGEVCALKWCDFRLDGVQPRVMIRRALLDIDRKRIVQDTKTHAIRWVGLDEGTVELILQHKARAIELAVGGTPLDPDDFVFPKKPGSKEPVPPNSVGQAWRRLCDELDVKARLHELRHLQASLLLDAGEAITTVAARLGHRDTSTTLRIYSHLMPGADREPPPSLAQRSVIPRDAEPLLASRADRPGMPHVDRESRCEARPMLIPERLRATAERGG